MSHNSETVDNCKTTLTADDSCRTELIEIVPLETTSDDYRTPEFTDSLFVIKPEDLQDVKEETADKNDTADQHFSVKLEPADYDNTDVLQCLMKVIF